MTLTLTLTLGDRTPLKRVVPRFAADLIHELYNEGFDGQVSPQPKIKIRMEETLAWKGQARCQLEINI